MAKAKKIHVIIASGSLLALAFIFHLIDLVLLKAIALIIATITAGFPIVRRAIQTTMIDEDFDFPFDS